MCVCVCPSYLHGHWTTHSKRHPSTPPCWHPRLPSATEPPALTLVLVAVDVEFGVEVGLLGAEVLLGAVQRGLLPRLFARSRAVRRPSGGRVARLLLRDLHVGNVTRVVHAARVPVGRESGRERIVRRTGVDTDEVLFRASKGHVTEIYYWHEDEQHTSKLAIKIFQYAR